MKEGKSNTVLLTVIGIATLLVAVVGATFAYFSARVSGEDTSVVQIQAASQGTQVESSGSDADIPLTTDGIYPSDTSWLTKEVTLYSQGTTKAQGAYSFDLVVTENTFENNDIAYLFTVSTNSSGDPYTATTVTSADTVGGTKHPIAKLVDDSGNGTIESSEYDTYSNIATGTVAKDTQFNVVFKLDLFFVNNPNVNQNYETQRSFVCYVKAHYEDTSVS